MIPRVANKKWVKRGINAGELYNEAATISPKFSLSQIALVQFKKKTRLVTR